jgi:hypothetical protein
MKKIAVLIALLLALSPVASALTVAGEDLGSPVFSWGTYQLELVLYTDDPAQVNLPAPGEGTDAMVRLAPVSGQVALYDIVGGAKRFELKDASGTAYALSQWRAPGTAVKNGAQALADQQDSFDVIYRLPKGVDAGSLSLYLTGEDGTDRLVTPLSATPSAEAVSPGEQATDFVNRLLLDEAEKAKDPWVQAILRAGVKDAALEDGALTFTLRSFNPGLKSIVETEPREFLRHLYQNASAYDLKCTLAVTDEGGLQATAKSQKALIKAVQKAASASKKGFNDKKVRAALAGYLLSNLASQDMRPGASSEEFEPLFAAQQKQALSVNGGPHALVMTTTGAKGDDLLTAAYASAYLKLSKQQGANKLSQDEIKRAYLEEMSAQAAALKKKGAEKIDFTLDIDQLFATEKPYAGDQYNSFIFKYDGAYNVQLYALYQDVSAMPDYPAMDFPKSGRIAGSNSGTKVIFKDPKDGYPTLIQMRKVDTDELMVTAFVNPGQSASVRVPKGQYYILAAAGFAWYGEEHMFGDGGFYFRTQDMQIKGSNYYHVITLSGASDEEGGNMSANEVEPYVFLQPGGVPNTTQL